jgi:predicted nuclease of predicted toxin-antitoxin system
MRFLADAGISPATIDYLAARGHDAIHVRSIGLQRAADSALIDLAVVEGRILLTFDLDFGDILALQVRDKPSVIILRLGDERAAHVNSRLGIVIKECADDLSIGALVLVEDSRYRVRKLPIGR